MSERLIIGIDLGGTRIKAVAMDANRQICYEHYEPTNDGEGMAWKYAVAAAIERIEQQFDRKSDAIGISAPGLASDDNSAIAFMPGRMHGLEQFNWSEWLGKRAWVINDGLAALMAEARLGAAAEYRNVILLTLGTGVGGAILINGQPYQGAFGKAGHLGHMTVDHDGEPDITGTPGSLEDAIGNVTISKRSHGRFESTHALLEAYRNGDAFAASVWLTSVRKLAAGMASLSNILSPECAILSGGITEAGEDLFGPLEQFISQYEWRTGGNRMQIRKARFGDLAGAVGAACYAFEKY